MSEETEKRLDKLAEILWCERIVRRDGSVSYWMVVGKEKRLLMTQRLQRLDRYIAECEQVSRTDGFQASQPSSPHVTPDQSTQ